MQIPWTGVYPALTTAFDEKGALDIPGLLHLVQAQLDAGVDGLILAGSLGESSTLSREERLDLLSAAVEFVQGQVPVLLNIAEGSTREAARFAREAQDKGADGLMLLPPMMYKPEAAETLAFFSAVAQSTDLPILVYNNPVDYKTEVTPDMFEELLMIDTIQAVKESTRDISNVSRLRARFGARLKILCGVDTLALEALLMGADGWVAGLADAFPRETVAVYRLARSGRVAEAIDIYRWFLPLLELDLSPQLVQNIKLAASLTGLGNENVRLPRRPLQGAARSRVRAILEQGLASRPVLPAYLHL